MSKTTKGHQMLAALEKRVAELENRTNELERRLFDPRRFNSQLNIENSEAPNSLAKHQSPVENA